MKTIAATIALALLAPPAAFAAEPAPAAPAGPPPANFTGTWTGTSVFPATPERASDTATPVCAFQQALDRIRGSCLGPFAVGLATGTVKGRTATWSWTLEPNTPSTRPNNVATFEATLGDDGVIRGGMTLLGRTGVYTARK